MYQPSWISCSLISFHGFLIEFRKFLFDVKTAQLMPIEESQPLGLVTSKIIGKADGNALFTVQDHYGAVMAIPQNTLQLWPGNENSKEEDVVLLPHQNMVNAFIIILYNFAKVKRQNVIISKDKTINSSSKTLLEPCILLFFLLLFNHSINI